MKYFFSALLFLHGAIHLMGFLKAFKLAEIEQLNASISKLSGFFWLIASILFLTAGIAYLAKADFWYIVALVAVIISSVLIISVWKDAKFGTLPNIIILTGVIIGYATISYAGTYSKDVKIGLKQTESLPEILLTEGDIGKLPELVRNYIRYSGAVGKPKVNNFKVECTGKIRRDEQSEWMPFVTEQYNFPGSSTRLFFMKAVMMHLPVAGYHCFKNGAAFMDIRLFSLIKVQYQSGKEMDIAETVTLFNDMCCMAPATLIDNRIKWMETDSSSVKAEFTNNEITISANLFFNDKGELVNFISEDRYAFSNDNSMKQIPWSTPLKDYQDIGGYKLPGYAEAIYSYPEGDFCYGSFNLTNVEYNCKSTDK